ncbi:MAG: acetate--CoA ligase family protein [Elusimicrobiota bacterium]
MIAKSRLDRIETIFDDAAARGRNVLLEPEAYDVLSLLSLSAPRHVYIRSGAPLTFSAAGSFHGKDAVVKVASSKHLHKTDSGGVAIVGKNRGEITAALDRMFKKFPEAEGVLIAEFVEYGGSSLGHELILGARHDEAFGPVLSFGPGGTGVEELTEALKAGLSPAIAECGRLGSLGARDFLSNAWIWRYLSGGVRGSRRLVTDEEMEKWLRAFAEVMRAFSDGNKRKWTIEELEVNPLVVSGGRLSALDCLLRFRPAADGKRRARRPLDSIRRLMNPRHAAFVGVGGPAHVGRIILNNVVSEGFDIKNLHVIKEGVDAVDGVPCVPSISELPHKVDMLVMSTSSAAVPQLLREAAQSGKVEGAVIISGGMGEKAGTESLQDAAREVIRDARAKGSGFVAVGGNSLGIISAPAKLNTFFIPPYKMEPRRPPAGRTADTAFISQSGAFIISAMSRLDWFAPLYAVSAGNQLDATIADYTECVLNDPKVKVIVLYIEGFMEGDGERLTTLIRRARRLGKTVICYKAGRTPTGRQAVRGHTASIAGEYPTARAALSTAGAVVVESFDDFDDVLKLACAFSELKGKGRRTYFITNAGFESAGMADSLGPRGTLRPAAIGRALRTKLKKTLAAHKLDKLVDPHNPLDLTPMAGDDAYCELLEHVLTDKAVDAVILSAVPLTPAMQTLPPGKEHPEDLAASLIPRLGKAFKRCGKPIVFCVSSGALYDDYVRAAEAQGLPVLRNADRAARALARYLQT